MLLLEDKRTIDYQIFLNSLKGKNPKAVLLLQLRNWLFSVLKFDPNTGMFKDYDLDAQFIKDLLLNQNMKDYYTGKIPKDSSDYSIDRVNSSKGYTRDNIVITTTNINTMKMDMSLDTFKYNIEILYNHLIKNQD